MVQFGATLVAERKQEWAQFYIDYNALKKHLKELRAAYNKADPKPRDSRRHDLDNFEAFKSTASRSPSSNGVSTLKFLRRRLTMGSTGLEDEPGVTELEGAFRAALDAEVEKVVLFFLHKQGHLAALLLEARNKAEKGVIPRFRVESTGSEDALSSMQSLPSSPAGMFSVYRDIGFQIVQLINFLLLNVQALRKILKKHDKQVRDKLIATYYLSSRAQAKYSSMRQLYNNEGILALVASLRNAFAAAEAERVHSLESRAALARIFDEADDGSHLEAGLRHEHKRMVRTVSVLRHRSLSEVSSSEGIFVEIAAAQRALAAAQRQTVVNYMSIEVLLGHQLSELDEDVDSEQKRQLDLPSAYINLATTFLYMTNYYIVGPTSAEYASALGASPAVSGVIIGMTPIAACFSCLLYSWWTNWSFRGPLLLCSWMLVLGNLLYALALSYGACWMVLVGRTLIGLGGARGVNRRYIADTIPIESRTAYSAAFVAAGALGMAFGPFLAALTNDIEFEVGVLEFNGLTNPGWVMLVCWVILGALIQFVFQEPPHDEIKRAVGSDSQSSDRAPARPESGDSRYPAGSSMGRAYGATKDGGAKPSAAVADAGSVGAAKASSVGGEERQILLESSTMPNGGEEAVSTARRKQESSPLLVLEDSRDDEDEEADAERARSCKCGPLSAITPPLAFCLFGYFVNKLVVEAAVSSAPVLTQYMFDWSVDRVGVLMAALGLLVLPVNVAVGRMSLVVEDRVLLQVLAVLTAIGCLVMLEFPGLPFEFTEFQYVIGVGLVFIALQAHEGVVMSITSKIIPPSLARGTWNSGFLATEAGSFGRFVGDFAITLMGLMTLDWLDFLLFVPAVILVIFMVIGFWVAYPFLQG